MVAHATVNRRVTGSNPVAGAIIFENKKKAVSFQGTAFFLSVLSQRLEKNFYAYCPSSSERIAAASTASIKVARMAPFSNA